MLCMSVQLGVSSNGNGKLVIAEDYSRTILLNTQVDQQASHPNGLTRSWSHVHILCFCAGECYDFLLFGTPDDRARAQVEDPIGGALAVINTSFLVIVHISLSFKVLDIFISNTLIDYTRYIMKYSFHRSHMMLGWALHVTRNQANCECEIGYHMSEIQEATHHASILLLISLPRAIAQLKLLTYI